MEDGEHLENSKAFCSGGLRSPDRGAAQLRRRTDGDRYFGSLGYIEPHGDRNACGRRYQRRNGVAGAGGSNRYDYRNRNDEYHDDRQFRRWSLGLVGIDRPARALRPTRRLLVDHNL